MCMLVAHAFYAIFEMPRKEPGRGLHSYTLCTVAQREKTPEEQVAGVWDSRVFIPLNRGSSNISLP